MALHLKPGAENALKITELLLAEEVITVKGVNTYGIEFVEAEDPAADFWGITFPTP